MNSIYTILEIQFNIDYLKNFDLQIIFQSEFDYRKKNLGLTNFHLPT